MADARQAPIALDAGALAPDVTSVAALAWLQLAARRLGRSVQLRNTTDELRRLLGFLGLADALGAEPEREPEQREERRRVEEEGELDDPAA